AVILGPNFCSSAAAISAGGMMLPGGGYPCSKSSPVRGKAHHCLRFGALPPPARGAPNPQRFFMPCFCKYPGGSLMDANLLATLFGVEGRGSGPCRIIVNAEAHVHTIGSDAIVQGGIKAYSPRLITGRVPADNVMMLPGQRALVLYKRTVHRTGNAEDRIQTTVQVVDTDHVVAVDFETLDALKNLGLPVPDRESPSRCEPNYTATR